MPKKLKIYKWINPLKNMKKGDDLIKGGEEGEEFLEMQDEEGVMQTGTKVLGTPFGLVPIDNQWLIDNHIEFWMIETNFNINTEIQNSIKNIHGVEILHVFTRYKARVGIPKSGLFKSSIVINNIKNKISELFRAQQIAPLSELPLDIAEKCVNLRDNLYKKYDYWGFIVLPNGNIESVCSNTDDDFFKQKIEILKSTSKLTRAKIILSE